MVLCVPEVKAPGWGGSSIFANPKLQISVVSLRVAVRSTKGQTKKPQLLPDLYLPAAKIRLAQNPDRSPHSPSRATDSADVGPVSLSARGPPLT